MNGEQAEGVMTPARRLSGAPLVAAMIAILLWAVFVIVMIFAADDESDVTWARLAFLLASVEAVAFAAGGALWGASIQRERAEKAETRAAQNEQDAASGKSLGRVLIEDETLESRAGAPGVQRLGGEGRGVVERHASLARALFPDL
jgi:hypothetical protein